MQTPELPETPFRRILVVRPDEIGDAVLTTPVLRELHRAYPSARVTLVVKPQVAQLFEACPYVARVVTFDQGVSRLARPLVLPWRAWRLAVRELRHEQYDLAVLPRWDTDAHFATLLAWFSGAPRRIGHSSRVNPRKAKLNAGFDRLLTDVIGPGPLKPLVEHHLDVVRRLGVRNVDPAPELWTTAGDDEIAARLLNQHPAGAEGPLVAIAPAGGNSRLKQWPIERFANLADRLAARPGVRLVVVGGPGEEPLGRQLSAAAPSRTLDLVGRTSVRELVAVLRRCRLFVGNDAGPLHMASAVGLTTVAVFGASDAERYAPLGAQHRVLCRILPCSPVYQPGRPDRCRACMYPEPRCLLGVEVGEVEAAVLAALEASARRAALAGKEDWR